MKTTKQRGRPRGVEPNLAEENGKLLGYFLQNRKDARTKHGAIVAARAALHDAGGRYLEYEAVRKRVPRVLRELAEVMRDDNDEAAREWWARHISKLTPEARRGWERAYAFQSLIHASRRQSQAATT